MLFENRRMPCLFNPTEEQMVEREPLLKYSFYLSSKNNLILSMIDDILVKLDRGFSEKILNADLIGDCSILTWFWTLGAYEIVRTMSQTKDCFSEKVNDRIEFLKKQLATARIPNTKMEKKGRKEPVNSNRSFDGWDLENKDLLVGDPESPLSARYLFKLYDETISSILPSDVLGRHETSAGYKK